MWFLQAGGACFGWDFSGGGALCGVVGTVGMLLRKPVPEIVGGLQRLGSSVILSDWDNVGMFMRDVRYLARPDLCTNNSALPTKS